MILIIDGHGTEHTESFDFKRSAAANATLYSYTKAGISAQGMSSIAWIKTAVEGNIPSGYVELNKSKIGGTLLKDRLLTPLASTDAPFDHFPGGFVDFSNADYRLFSNADGKILYFALALDSNSSILLSQILNFYPDQSLDVIWAPCRGSGGAASVRYSQLQKLLQTSPAKFQELFNKTYP